MLALVAATPGVGPSGDTGAGLWSGWGAGWGAGLVTGAARAEERMDPAADPPGPGMFLRHDKVRVLAGDRIVLLGRELALDGVRCPSPETEDGRQARALANLFLRGAEVTCRYWPEGDGFVATCTVEKLRWGSGPMDLSQRMIGTGLCHGTDGVPA